MLSAPPAVELVLGSGRRERLAVALLYATASGVAMAWWLAHRRIPDGWPMLAAAVLGAWLGWHVLRLASGRLCWDGASWHLRSGALAGPKGLDVPLHSVQLQFDLGPWLLVRAKPLGQRALWCGISARQAGSAWHALRLALYHRASVQGQGTR